MSAILEVDGLVRRFGGLIAVNDVSLSVEEGEIRGLIGPNGAGKTTLFNLISGTLPPTAGRVRFEGKDITGVPMHDLVRRDLVRTFQHAQLFPSFTVLRSILVGLSIHARSGFWSGLLDPPSVRRHNDALTERAHEIIAFTGLTGRENELAGSLPHGFRRILQVAIGLAPKPRLLLLDEPVAGVNPTLAREIGDHLRGLVADGISVLLIEHHMDTIAALCDPVIVMAEGRHLREGSFAEVAADPLVQEAYMGRGR